MSNVYCLRTDLVLYAINAQAIAGIADAVVDSACAAASSIADSKFRARYPLPLLTWGVDVRSNTAKLAAYDVLVTRGMNPAGADRQFLERYDRAMRWFDDVERQCAHPDVTYTATTSPNYSAPYVISKPQRGF